MEKRNTIQKELVLNAVTKMHRHVTADEVYDYIKKDYPSIGKGTVYRNLSILAEEMDSFIRDKHGIKFLDYDILFKGICKDCQNREKEQ